MLLHFVSCDWHCGWTPAEYAANAVYLQWGLQTYPKNGQLLLFPKRWTVRQRIFGKTENEICCATTGLMKHQPRKNWSVWFRQSFGQTGMVNCVEHYLSPNLSKYVPRWDVICSQSETYVIMRHGVCVRRAGLSSLRGSSPQQYTRLPFWKSALLWIRFCGLTIPLDNWIGSTDTFLYVRANGCAGMRGMGGDTGSGAERETPAWRAIHGWIVRRPHTKNNDTCVSHTSQNGTPRHQHGGRHSAYGAVCRCHLLDLWEKQSTQHRFLRLYRMNPCAIS